MKLLKTWQIEAAVVAAVLFGVTFLTANRLVEYVGALAVLLTFCHAQIAFRFSEAVGTAPGEPQHTVQCWRWSSRYFVGKELVWLVYFGLHHAFSAIIGVAVFLLYPLWRRYWAARQSNGH